MENEVQHIVSVPTPSSNNWSKILLFIVLELIVISGSIFVGIQIGKNQVINTNPITLQPTNIDTENQVKFTGWFSIIWGDSQNGNSSIVYSVSNNTQKYNVLPISDENPDLLKFNGKEVQIVGIQTETPNTLKLISIKTATPSETTPTAKPSTTTTKPISIPSNWKQYTATDPEFKIKTTMSMPPGFSFRFTGSEFTIQNDSDATELWDYSTSVFSGKDGLRNYYDGTSRRDWYERKLNGEFMIQEEYQKKRGDILSVNEKNIGAQSYLEILVQPISGNQETHYIFLEDGIVNIIKPASNEANSSNSKISNYIGTIFASLKASSIK